jgi:hypothetical protein
MLNFGLSRNSLYDYLNLAAPQQRLDPNAMPSFVQVVEDDRGVYANRFFNTGYPTAEQPPLVTTDFVANDTGLFAIS